MLPLWGDSITEAIRINLKNEKDAELIVDVEIQNEFYKYDLKLQ